MYSQLTTHKGDCHAPNITYHSLEVEVEGGIQLLMVREKRGSSYITTNGYIYMYMHLLYWVSIEPSPLLVYPAERNRDPGLPCWV